jgi:hypothetical protein
MAVLQKMAGGRAGEWIQLSPGTIRIGRSESSNLRLSAAAASKLHASIECFESHCEVTDLNSRNGTFVNGIRIDRSHHLRHGDRLDFAGATFVYLDAAVDSDDDSFGSSSNHLSNPLKVLTPVSDNLDPEQSIRRKIVRTGDIVSCGDLTEFPGIDGPRVIAAMCMHDLPLATWNCADSTRKISHVIRLTQAILVFHEQRKINDLLQVLLDLFPAASHALIAMNEAAVNGFRIVAAVSRQDGDVVFLCHPLVHRAVTDCEGLLVTDHWRNNPDTKPRLTELNRQSLLCVPIPGLNQTCQGVMQLQANDPGRPFSEPDLQRLAVLSHILGATLPGFRHLV